MAKELGTGRTAVSCFMRYSSKHNSAVNNRRWERSEDERLRRLVEQCRINNHIPWSKVSYYMTKRTKDQCYQRYIYSLRDNIRKGTFTEAVRSSQRFLAPPGLIFFPRFRRTCCSSSASRCTALSGHK